MECPKCKAKEMRVIMAETLGTWWRCDECHFEVCRPDEKPDDNDILY